MLCFQNYFLVSWQLDTEKKTIPTKKNDAWTLPSRRSGWTKVEWQRKMYKLVFF
jgi:hypothetical protein